MEMEYTDLGVVILAAGKGTRMKSDLAKVLHRVAGKSMVVHVVESVLGLANGFVYVVVGHQADQVKEEVGRYAKVAYVLQKNLLGTGDAVKAAIPKLHAELKDILVLCGDVPLIRESTLKALIDGHQAAQAAVTVLATTVENPTGYGRIIQDKDGNMLCIREEADASDGEKQVQKVNTGIYCFNRNFLVSALDYLTPDNHQAEYYLTDVIGIARDQNQKIGLVTMDDPRQVMGVNTLEELAKAEALILQLENELS